VSLHFIMKTLAPVIQQTTGNTSSVLKEIFGGYDPTKAVAALDSLRYGDTPLVTWWSVTGFLTLCYTVYTLFFVFTESKIPFVGKHFELRAIKDWRFLRDATAVLHDGYTKVSTIDNLWLFFLHHRKILISVCSILQAHGVLHEPILR
jgi:hypothetical protein